MLNNPFETEEERKQKIRARFNARKKMEFFAITPDDSSTYKNEPAKSRCLSWLRAFTKAKLPNDAFMLDGNGIVSFLFRGGLRLTDYGYHVSFSAMESKDKVDMETAKKVVRCAANYLYRQGWNTGIILSSVREGSEPLLAEFDKAYERKKRAASRPVPQHPKTR